MLIAIVLEFLGEIHTKSGFHKIVSLSHPQTLLAITHPATPLRRVLASFVHIDDRFVHVTPPLLHNSTHPHTPAVFYATSPVSTPSSQVHTSATMRNTDLVLTAAPIHTPGPACTHTPVDTSPSLHPLHNLLQQPVFLARTSTPSHAFSSDCDVLT